MANCSLRVAHFVGSGFACLLLAIGISTDALGQSYYYGKSSKSPVLYSASRLHNNSGDSAKSDCTSCDSGASVSCGCGGPCGCDSCGGCDDCCDCDDCGGSGTLPFYVALSGGWSSLDPVVDPAGGVTAVFDDGFAMNFAIGKHWRWLRTEFEYSFFNFDAVSVNVPAAFAATNGSANIHAFMYNGYFDLPLGDSRFGVYGGGGLGFAQVSLNSLVVPGLVGGANATSDFTFAWQFRTGMSFEVYDNCEAYMGYRYFDTSAVTLADPGTIGVFNANGVLTHNIEWGLRFNF